MPKKAKQHRANVPRPKDDRPSAAARGYDAEWRRIRLGVLAESPVCEECRRASAQHVDHIIPLGRGGTHARSNLRALCHSCHSRKTAAHDGGFGRAPKEYREGEGMTHAMPKCPRCESGVARWRTRSIPVRYGCGTCGGEWTSGQGEGGKAPRGEGPSDSRR